MFALISTEELAEMNQIMVKQLKNRYNDTAVNRKFILGINRAKMKVFDIKKDDAIVMPTPQQQPQQQSQKQFPAKQKKFDDWNF
jgi:hypothetical protein